MCVYIPQIISFNSIDIYVSDKSVDGLTLPFIVSLVPKKSQKLHAHTNIEKKHFPP